MNAETQALAQREEAAAIELFDAMCRDRGFEPYPWSTVPEGVKETTRRFVRIVNAVMAKAGEDEAVS